MSKVSKFNVQGNEITISTTLIVMGHKAINMSSMCVTVHAALKNSKKQIINDQLIKIDLQD